MQQVQRFIRSVANGTDAGFVCETIFVLMRNAAAYVNTVGALSIQQVSIDRTHRGSTFEDMILFQVIFEDLTDNNGAVGRTDYAIRNEIAEQTVRALDRVMVIRERAAVEELRRRIVVWARDSTEQVGLTRAARGIEERQRNAQLNAAAEMQRWQMAQEIDRTMREVVRTAPVQPVWQGTELRGIGQEAKPMKNEWPPELKEGESVLWAVKTCLGIFQARLSQWNANQLHVALSLGGIDRLNLTLDAQSLSSSSTSQRLTRRVILPSSHLTTCLNSQEEPYEQLSLDFTGSRPESVTPESYTEQRSIRPEVWEGLRNLPESVDPYLHGYFSVIGTQPLSSHTSS